MRRGYSDQIERDRAFPTHGGDPENDFSLMVQEQVARLRHLRSQIPLDGKRILDWGCGTGYNLAWMAKHTKFGQLAGFDISKPTIDFARRFYPDFEFFHADGADTHIDFGKGTWDVILCCEVLEHVTPQDQPEFLQHIHDHLSLGGVAYITVPNVNVFSLGVTPSPVNGTHLGEPSLEQFTKLMSDTFGKFDVRGQRFRQLRHEKERAERVRAKIEEDAYGETPGEVQQEQKQAGRIKATQSGVSDSLVSSIRRIPLVHPLWKMIRWKVADPISKRFTAITYRDFEFVEASEPNVIWFAAVAKRKMSGAELA